ncbi:MAG: HD-GYP domain-containing protein [Clostridia bacterium]|nr:HD-GYP domain-containing protein [Clostridia bacterium]
MLKDYEQLIYEQIERMVDTFINTEHLTKMDFIKKAFFSAFDLIQEAEKGSYYELMEGYYRPIVSKGYRQDLLMQLKFKEEESFMDYVCDDIINIKSYSQYVETRSNTQFSDEMIELFKGLGTYEPFYTMYAPVIVDKKMLGIICLDNFKEKPFSDLSLKILKFYAQMISNFYTLLLAKEKEVKNNQEIVMALVSAIEINDVYTKGHGRRVQYFSTELAKALNLSKDEISDISTAALLHDVGKIGISKEILNKPDKLTDDEYDIIKLHPTYTKQILENISNFQQVVNYAYCHHEYYNGKGYPRGLKGDEIPLGAQIIMISDVYDALTDDRAYRKAFTKVKAIEMIRDNSGKMFDPSIVDVAIDVFTRNEKNYILK